MKKILEIVNPEEHWNDSTPVIWNSLGQVVIGMVPSNYFAHQSCIMKDGSEEKRTLVYLKERPDLLEDIGINDLGDEYNTATSGDNLYIVSKNDPWK